MWSRDAGDFYCNEVYYRTLHFIRDNMATNAVGALLPAMFIHVPNFQRSSVENDVEIVRRVVGHSLWATYVGPDRRIMGLNSVSSMAHMDIIALTVVTLASLLLGLLGGVWLTGRERRKLRRSSLREPLDSSSA